MTNDAKDSIAQAMVAKRWAKTTPEQRSRMARDMARLRWGPKKKKR